MDNSCIHTPNQRKHLIYFSFFKYENGQIRVLSTVSPPRPHNVDDLTSIDRDEMSVECLSIGIEVFISSDDLLAVVLKATAINMSDELTHEQAFIEENLKKKSRYSRIGANDATQFIQDMINSKELAIHIETGQAKTHFDIICGLYDIPEYRIPSILYNLVVSASQKQVLAMMGWSAQDNFSKFLIGIDNSDEWDYNILDRFISNPGFIRLSSTMGHQDGSKYGLSANLIMETLITCRNIVMYTRNLSESQRDFMAEQSSPYPFYETYISYFYKSISRRERVSNRVLETSRRLQEAVMNSDLRE